VTPENLVNLIIDLVPQYYTVNIGGGNTFPITIANQKYRINTFRSNTPQLASLIRKIENNAQSFLDICTGSEIIDQEIVESRIVNMWLNTNNYNANWPALFDYCRILESRTYENSSIGFTYIVNQESSDKMRLIDCNEQKILDVLAESHYTYFDVSPEWNYIDYNFVPWQKIQNTKAYKLIPEFIWPYKCILETGQYAVTRTKRGDIIIYNRSGMLAAYRKGNWKIYESTSLKNAVVDAISWTNSGTPYYMAANLFEICLDLSYRRHGALIIIDKDNCRERCISNPESLIESGNSLIRSTLSNRISQINLGDSNFEIVHKPLILELASIDGALVFGDDGRLKSFGSIITPHSEVKNETGARSTAAASAFHHGMRPIKISSDGEITVYHKHEDPHANKMKQVKLSFL